MYEMLWEKSAGASVSRLVDPAPAVSRLASTVPFEAVVWIVGLGAMAAMNPEGQHLFSLCPLDALGFSFCPGCGLGHAVAYLARGQLVASIQAHPLGIPAVVVLVHHVGRLFRSTNSAIAHLHRS